MRICIQRVKRASVTLPNHQSQPAAAKINTGLLILLGIGIGDTEREVKMLAKKSVELRIFEDEAGKMNRSVLDVGGSILVVSQFTLYADCRKGRRPSFTEAAPPDKADQLYRDFVETLKGFGVPVETGVFRADMDVELVNDGPITIWLDSDLFKALPCNKPSMNNQ
jgi:D-tyrosyl-tRNA(Tyr) deacylase